jgi:hypothetical protein
LFLDFTRSSIESAFEISLSDHERYIYKRVIIASVSQLKINQSILWSTEDPTPNTRRAGQTRGNTREGRRRNGGKIQNQIVKEKKVERKESEAIGTLLEIGCGPRKRGNEGKERDKDQRDVNGERERERERERRGELVQ